VAATVRDDRAELAQGDMTLALDGKNRSDFGYDAGTDRLVYDSGRLSLGRHTLKITATDAAGNTTTETKTFKVIRR
jgi:hypothetical protein